MRAAVGDKIIALNTNEALGFRKGDEILVTEKTIFKDGLIGENLTRPDCYGYGFVYIENVMKYKIINKEKTVKVFKIFKWLITIKEINKTRFLWRCEMFKERLKIACKKVGFGLLQIFILILMFTLIGGAIFLVSEYPTLKKIVEYAAYLMAGLVALLLLGIAIVNTYRFIQWLFVEPYKEKKKIKS